MPEDPLQFLVSKLRSRAAIDVAAEAAILDLPHVRKTYRPGAFIVREGATDFNICSLIVSGFAFRQKLSPSGSRQIVSLHLRGEMLDLQHLFFRRADHNVQALTELETLNIDRSALQELIPAQPAIGVALWIETLVEASIYREWMTNVGRRDARERIAHLLCEFAVRTRMAGLGDGQSCQLPMTQEQIADAVGLTNVHVSRTLKSLEDDGIIQRDRREIAFTNWEAIRNVADFDALYLHLDQPVADLRPDGRAPSPRVDGDRPSL